MGFGITSIAFQSSPLIRLPFGYSEQSHGRLFSPSRRLCFKERNPTMERKFWMNRFQSCWTLNSSQSLQFSNRGGIARNSTRIRERLSARSILFLQKDVLLNNGALSHFVGSSDSQQ
jgi:hypothetical protein